MVKGFISYCHKDEELFNNTVLPIINDLEKESNVEFFYDRKIRPDRDFQMVIDSQIEECDLSILFLSGDYYESENCQKEKIRLLERKGRDGIYVLSLVASQCNWKEDDSLKSNLFLNTDGFELSSLEENALQKEQDKIRKRLSTIIDDLKIIKDLSFSESFYDYLEDTDVLKTSHKSRNTLLLSDIFVYPTLRRYKYNDIDSYDISSETIATDSKSYRFVSITGDNETGKTSILKTLIRLYKEKTCCIPLFFSSEDNLSGHVNNIVMRAFRAQYRFEGDNNRINSLLDQNKERIIIFLDDVQKMRNSKGLSLFVDYSKVYFTVDYSYRVDYELVDIEKSLVRYSIRELTALQRDVLIKKWLSLDSGLINSDNNTYLKELDKKTEQIELVIGKSVKGGIMPAYPFLVLSVLSHIETLNRPMNQRITSYGYCYEALIIIALSKCGFKTDDEIGGALNFLAQFAYKLYKQDIFEFSTIQFDEFVDNYENIFSFPFEKKVFISKLFSSGLICKTTIGNYRFDYKYVYYFFVARYLSDNQDLVDEDIKFLCHHLHNEENGYIVLFFSHNTKSKSFYELLLKESELICSQYECTNLSSEEMDFFDNGYESLLKLVLPDKNHNYNVAREEKLQNKHEDEYNPIQKKETQTEDFSYVINLKKVIKLTEVIGMVVKNRYTSISRDMVITLLTSAIELNLRSLNEFFSLFRNPSDQNELIEYIAELVRNELSKKGHVDEIKSRRMASSLFWGLCFFYVFSIYTKLVYSIGSERIIPFIKEISDTKPTPFNKVLLDGMKIIYAKNIDKKEVFRHNRDKEFSQIARNIIKILVIDYCRLNPISYPELQELSSNLEIPINKLDNSKKL